MRLVRPLILLSAVVFLGTGLGYVVVPGLMLSVVGVDSTATSDFLIRTEGVALLFCAGALFAVRDGTPRQWRIALAALAAYYVLGSLVDLAAYAQGTVGPASVPSAAVRIVAGVVCLVVAARIPTPAGPP